MEDFKITNLADPVDLKDAVNKQYVDSVSITDLNPPTNHLSMGDFKITNLADPIGLKDAVNK